MTAPLPPGLTSLEPVEAPYRRWNGAVWDKVACREYNRQLAAIRDAWNGNLSDVQARINDLYRYAAHTDKAMK